MPELPEVENSRRQIMAVINGHTFAGACVRQPKLRLPITAYLDRCLQQRVVTAVRRRAKYLLIDTNGGSLIVHFGMSGSLHFAAPNSPPTAHDHLDLRFTNGTCLRLRDPRRFGIVLWHPGEGVDVHPRLRDLGLEPLEDGFTAEALYRICHHRQRAIKPLLMDQHIVAGIGNIYASEALFEAGIHPHRLTNCISQRRYGDLVNAVRNTLRMAIDCGGTTLRDYIDPYAKTGTFKAMLRVYSRAGEPCHRCRKPISKCFSGQRSTFYCNRCQR